MICYSYGEYANLQDLCDETVTHTVSNALGQCFTEFTISTDPSLFEETREYLLDAEPTEVIQLTDVVNLAINSTLENCGSIGYRLKDETQADIIQCSIDGTVQLKTVTDETRLGLHEIQFEAFLHEIDGSALHPIEIDLTLKVDIVLP